MITSFILQSLVGIYLFSAVPEKASDATSAGQTAKIEQLMSEATRLAQAGKATDAIPIAEDAMVMVRKLHGAKSEETARQMVLLGSIYHWAKDDVEAAAVLQKALAIYRTTLGASHPVTAATRDRVIEKLIGLKDYESAQPLLVESVDTYMKLLGPECATTATALHQLGIVSGLNKNDVGARKCLEQALLIRLRVLGEIHAETQESVQSLIEFYVKCGNPQAAVPFAEKVVLIRRRTLGARHVETAKALEHLGRLCRMAGDVRDARLCFEDALAIYEAEHGNEHEAIARVNVEIGATHFAAGALWQATESLDKAVKLRRQLGAEHADTAEALRLLGAVHAISNQEEEARRCFAEALAISRKVSGPKHPSVADSQNAIGMLAMAEGDVAAAAVALEESLAIRRAAFGMENLDTAQSLYNLASLHWMTGDHDKAITEFEGAHSVRWALLGDKHPSLATTYHRMGICYMEMDDFVSARKNLDEAVVVCRNALGRDNLDTAAAVSDLGELMYRMGNYEDAQTYFEEALDIRQRVVGPDHALTEEARTNLKRLQTALKEDGAISR